MGRLNSTIIDDKKCFIAGQCFIATVREIVTPTQTHTLFLNTTRCFGGLGYISTNLSIFVVSIGVTIFTKKNFR